MIESIDPIFGRSFSELLLKLISKPGIVMVPDLIHNFRNGKLVVFQKSFCSAHAQVSEQFRKILPCCLAKNAAEMLGMISKVVSQGLQRCGVAVFAHVFNHFRNFVFC